jgi:hypothetical protein
VTSELPAVPDPDQFHPDHADRLAADVIAWVEQTDDLDAITEAQARLAALEQYLARRDPLNLATMQAASRRTEARIGQLLGPASATNGRPLPRAVKVHHSRRSEFRLLAQHFDVWWPDGAGQSRAAVLRAIDEARHPRMKRWQRLQARDQTARQTVLAEQPADAHGVDWVMVNGPFQDRLAHLDAAVDVVVTDPPYARDAHYLWEDLAAFAARALRPGGVLLALTGKLFLPDVHSALSTHLTYGWEFAQLMPGPNSRIITRRIAQEWKPVLAFTRGSWPQWIDWHRDIVETKSHPSARSYGWEQDEAAMGELIAWLAPPGAVVCDPMAGVGTYGTAALKAGCRFIGCELDTSRAESCAARLADGDRETPGRPPAP